jgi:hypothetical protein
MNDGLITYPRISSELARVLYDERRGLAVEDLSVIAATSYERQEWHPTIPSRVSEEALSKLGDDVREIATDNGYPAPQPRGRHVAFDQTLATFLYEHMHIAPSEAAAGGMWSFLALVLLPDVAAWRFPDWHPDRFIGADLMIGTSNRHTFGRLWARIHVLGSEVSSALGEDNVANIFERPTFGGDPRLARAIGEAHLRTVEASGIAQSQELMRDAMKRLRRLAVLITFGALSDEQLSTLLNDAFSASAEALSRLHPRTS